MGEGGELFVLDMGKPVKITEMAETLIRLHGYKPYKDIEIVFTGIRPGEKLYEELFYDPDHVGKTASEKIYLSKSTEEKNSLLPRGESLLRDSAEAKISEDDLKAEIFALAELSGSAGRASEKCGERKPREVTVKLSGSVGVADEKAINI